MYQAKETNVSQCVLVSVRHESNSFPIPLILLISVTNSGEGRVRSSVLRLASLPL
ncbi:hypothetical protein HanXRQr2_Chr14g0642091 [Helianthus annuus]|uniref:Uncharacterized protein n=1 Tax=Helianthus annuus TaxID=4232 RepID=A0A9K3H7I8_HELAN|nr:hypothetical protein HanXRQr2_Chr14g0642091 [Helianthus annuus]KAJ0840209.1 hypothetical protein HanPSC8_Chr14g0615941 [Helianthus annuus]